MKKISACSGSPELLLLAHTKTLSFEWGRSMLDAFLRQARKQNVTVRLTHHWQEVLQQHNCSLLAVIGVDREWLDEALDQLLPAGLRVILLDGVISSTHNNISRILSDQSALVNDQLALLKSRGRTRTAYFGVQKNDTSDASKAEAFLHYGVSQDVYPITESADACFERFYANIDRYDSVICSNDLIAVYLLGRCRELGIAIPEQLHILGNCDLWISRHVTPALSTAAYYPDTTAAVTLQLFRNLEEFPSICSMNVFMKADLLDRASTEGSMPADTVPTRNGTGFQPGSALRDDTLCAELQQIKILDQVLSACTPAELTILQRLCEGAAYHSIAEEVYLSIDAVKYHIKKLYRFLGIHRQQELARLLEHYGIRLL